MLKLGLEHLYMLVGDLELGGNARLDLVLVVACALLNDLWMSTSRHAVTLKFDVTHVQHLLGSILHSSLDGELVHQRLNLRVSLAAGIETHSFLREVVRLRTIIVGEASRDARA